MTSFLRTFRIFVLCMALAPLLFAQTQDREMPAPQTCAFKRGVSIAHWLAKVYDPAGPGAPWFGQMDIQWIAAQGFDHLRIPLDGRAVWRADQTLDETTLQPLLRAMAWAREQKLGVVIDMHFLPGGVYDKDNQDPAIYTDKGVQTTAAAFLAAFAQRFKNEGPWLRFELINEPEAPQNQQLNELTAVLIAAVRTVDKERFLYITTNHSSTFATLKDLSVPSDPKTGIVLHYDEPSVFTHQRAAWKQCPADMPAVYFPGRVPDLRSLFPPDHFAHRDSLKELTVAEIEAAFDKAKAWLLENAPGHEIYLGEFGVFETAPDQSRRNYIHAVSQAASRRGWGWAVWSYHGGFSIRDERGQATPVLQGLFPKGE